MLLVQSIIIYSLFAWLLFVSSKRNTNSSINFKSKSFSFPKKYELSIFVFVLISALRWDVGVDYFSYLHNYEDMKNGFNYNREDIESGFLYISKLFAILHVHYTLYFGLWAFFQIVFVIKAFEDEPRILPYILLLIPLGGYYCTWMNGIRQMIVACSFLWSIQFVIKKQYVSYYLWIFVAYFIHHSVIILIPFYALSYLKKEWDNRWICYIILLVCIVWGLNPSWINFVLNFSDFINFIGYDNYAERMDIYISDDKIRRINWGPRQITLFLCYFFIIWNYRKVRAYFGSMKVDVCFHIFFIGICIYYLFVNTNHIFIRPTLYMTIFALPMSAYTIYYLKYSKNFLIFSCAFVLYSSYIFLANWAEFLKNESERLSILYQFCF